VTAARRNYPFSTETSVAVMIAKTASPEGFRGSVGEQRSLQLKFSAFASWRENSCPKEKEGFHAKAPRRKTER
jgi:hypothetical protein